MTGRLKVRSGRKVRTGKITAIRDHVDQKSVDLKDVLHHVLGRLLG
jgi:hypothetical protein